MPQYWNYWNHLISNIQAIENIKDEKEKQKKAQEFVNGLVQEYSKSSDFFIARILEIHSDIELINVPVSLMDSLKEALFCYINGQYLSSIAATGITAELFCVHIYQLYLMELGLSRLHIKRRLKSFKNIRQFERIHTLHAVVGTHESLCQVLHEIREKRNNAVHPGEGYNYKTDALECLQNLIDVLNAYSQEQKHIFAQFKEKKKEDNSEDC